MRSDFRVYPDGGTTVPKTVRLCPTTPTLPPARYGVRP